MFPASLLAVWTRRGSNGGSDVPEEHDEAENDVPVVQAEDGSNVVNVDFTKKK